MEPPRPRSPAPRQQVYLERIVDFPANARTGGASWSTRGRGRTLLPPVVESGAVRRTSITPSDHSLPSRACAAPWKARLPQVER
jgi:hypothetical protein